MREIELLHEPLDRIEIIQLQVAKRRLIVNSPQRRTLDALAYLSERLTLRGLSESPCDYSTRLIVEVDGSRLVHVDTDGGVEMEETPPPSTREAPDA